MVSCSGRAGTAVRGAGAPRATGHGRGVRLALGRVQLDAGLGSIRLRHLRIVDGREVEEISLYRA